MNIARIVLAILATIVGSHLAHAKPPAMPDGMYQTASLDFDGSMFTPFGSEKPLAVASTAKPDRELELQKSSVTLQSQRESGVLNLQEAATGSHNRAAWTGGIWLFLGGIWIIGTLVHHRHTIQTS